MLRPIIFVKPEVDKSILANPVTFKEYYVDIKRSKFRGIYGMERGSTEVGIEVDLEPMTFGNVTW